MRRTAVGNKIVDHSDIVAASPAPTTSQYSPKQIAIIDWARCDDKNLGFGIWCLLYYRFDGKAFYYVHPFHLNYWLSPHKHLRLV